MRDTIFSYRKCAACGERLTKKSRKMGIGMFMPNKRGLPCAPYFLCKRCSKKRNGSVEMQQAVNDAVERRYFAMLEKDNNVVH